MFCFSSQLLLYWHCNFESRFFHINLVPSFSIDDIIYHVECVKHKYVINWNIILANYEFELTYDIDDDFY